MFKSYYYVKIDCVLCWSNISIPNVTYYSEKNLKYNDEKISKEILLSFERYWLENVRIITEIWNTSAPQIFRELCGVLPAWRTAVLLALQFPRGVYLWNIKHSYVLSLWFQGIFFFCCCTGSA